MHPVLVKLTFMPVFPILLGIGVLLYVVVLLLMRRPEKERPQSVIATLRSLANTFFLLAGAALILFQVARIKYLPLNSYGLLLATAFLTGIYFAQKRAPSENIDPNHIANLSLGIIIAALVGSRLFYHLFEQPPRHLWEVFEFWKGGLVIYGGIICAALTAFFMIRRYKLNTGKVFDVYAPSIAIGIFIGRLGCFMAGCCYGNATDSVLGMVFPARAPVYKALSNVVKHSNEMITAFNKIPSHMVDHIREQRFDLVTVHPAQLYSSINGLIAFLLLTLFYKKKKFDGEVFLWLMVYYSITRFLIETMRIDTPHNLFLGQFSLSQAIGFFILPAALAVIIYKRISLHRKQVSHEQ